jgi:hypothetical protein
MADCLQDIICGNRTIIGIRDFAACAQPESGLFLNDLPGVSLKVAAAVANPEQHTGVQLMRQCLALSARRVFQDFSYRMAGYFDFNAVVEARKVNVFNNTVLPAVAADRGLVLKRWRSEAARIFIADVYVKAGVNGAATINIIDGSNTTAYNVTLIAGQSIVVPVNYRAESEEVRIVMDNTGVPVYSCDMASLRDPGCFSCGGARNAKGLFVAGWDGTQEVQRCYGIGAFAQIQCQEEIIICSLLRRMHFIMWYAAGIEFMRQRMESNRLNEIVLFTQERAKELLEQYTKDYEREWQSFVKSTYNYMRTLKGDCIQCTGNVYTQTTP